MTTQQFKCTLITDVILNRKAASEGPNSTLDFIPGNVFLGIVAASYEKFGAKALDVFHNGKVRFGDAHIGIDGRRSLSAAAALFTPKISLQPITVFSFHLNQMDSKELRSMQLKQLRRGFYDYLCDSPREVNRTTHFAIKSAYDREKRHATDEKMFAYESLGKGLELYFSVEAEDDAALEMVCSALLGRKSIGRSRSAQFGLVEIEKTHYQEVLSTGVSFADNLYTVYADARLIFLDKYGLPTFVPEATDLGFPEDAQIVWEKSQIRTFQYAPYNWKRKAFDTDRCGIEKGSVFVVRSSSSPSVSTYIGHYQNEGFGKVIYNPAFLLNRQFMLGNMNNPIPQEETNEICHQKALLTHLQSRKEEENAYQIVYARVNEWAKKHARSFTGESFASQWGAIRAIAQQSVNGGYSLLRSNISVYLGHGIAEEKWKERNRRGILLSFIDDIHNSIPGYESAAVVNLASVMAKLNR